MSYISLAELANLPPPIYMNAMVEMRMASPAAQEHSVDCTMQLWNADADRHFFRLVNSVVSVWQRAELPPPFLVYAEESFSDESAMRWKIIPFYSSASCISPFWQQLKVLWRLTFGGITPSAESLDEQTRVIHQAFDESRRPDITAMATDATDPFCQDDVIARQQVLESEHARVLFPHAPLTNWHFLVIPKRHVTSLLELTPEEYVDLMRTSRMVIDQLKMNHEVTMGYYFTKFGREAGQMVPHMHLHLILIESANQDCFSRLKMVSNMMFGSRPLANQELESRVDAIKGEVGFSERPN